MFISRTFVLRIFVRDSSLILRVSFNKKYCTAPGRGIENVLFRNISYTGKHAELSVIAGYDEQRKIKNIVFENLLINGVQITMICPVNPNGIKLLIWQTFL
jgi:hypothetical protein